MIPHLVALIVRTLTLTLRVRIEDQSGAWAGLLPCPIVWAFWHNRVLIMPIIYRRVFAHRKVVALASASKDGAMVAGVLKRFGVGCVRGSSSRRGGAALRELTTAIETGHDIVIIPDGPRGPMYKLSPGVIKLAELTGSPVVPVHIEYTKYWQLRSWDGFRIPKPFSRVNVTFGVPFHYGCGEFEEERARLERIMVEGGSD
ncbi:MAG: lysophospholipid acyltransferase family protein [Verrucomicrobiota bacterium]